MKKKSNLSIFLFVQLFLIESVFQEAAHGAADKTPDAIEAERRLKRRHNGKAVIIPDSHTQEVNCPASGTPKLPTTIEDLAASSKDCIEGRERIIPEDSLGMGAEEFKEEIEFCACINSPVSKSGEKDSSEINYPLASIKSKAAEGGLSDYLILSEALSITRHLVASRDWEVDQRNQVVGKLHVFREAEGLEDEIFGKLLEIDRSEQNSCVTFKTFLDIQRLPKEPEDKAFLNYFQSLNTINPKDWDLDELKTQYNRAVAAKDKESVSFLKSKITFLKSNPLLDVI